MHTVTAYNRKWHGEPSSTHEFSLPLSDTDQASLYRLAGILSQHLLDHQATTLQNKKPSLNRSRILDPLLQTPGFNYNLTDIPLRRIPSLLPRTFKYFTFLQRQAEEFIGILEEKKTAWESYTALLNTPPITQKSTYQELLSILRNFSSLFLTKTPYSLTLWVETDDISLEDPYSGESVDFGAFLIRLRYPSSSLYPETPALNPNPCPTSSSVTHPHVNSDDPCLGEMSPALDTCLRSGLLSEVFHLVDTCLHTYTDHGAYEKLPRWLHQIECHDCGEILCYDDDYSCEQCGIPLCESCTYRCIDCGELFCRDHIDSCPRCGEYVCSGCLSSDGYCSSCQAEYEDEQEQERLEQEREEQEREEQEEREQEEREAEQEEERLRQIEEEIIQQLKESGQSSVPLTLANPIP